MLKLTREEGQIIYLGKNLSANNLEGSYDYRIDFTDVDHRVGRRRAEIVICDLNEIRAFTMTPEQPDIDFAPDMRIALLNTHEYMRGKVCASVASIGIRAPRDVTILRCDVNAQPMLDDYL
jgi:sRNA-binding carbon storage regulator CsrA